MRELAIERAIEVVGEAAKNISDSFKSHHPQIPWRDIARTRDFFAHSYFKIQIAAVWEVVSQDFPALIALLEQLVEEVE